MSGLSINGDTVHGLAIGGQAYHDLSNLKFKDHIVLGFDELQKGSAPGLVSYKDVTKFIGKNVFMCWSVTEGKIGDTDYKKASYCTNIFTLSFANTVPTASGDGDAIIDINTDNEKSVKVLVPSAYEDYNNMFNASGLIIQVD